MPGDKSIAHRWLILAATARRRERARGAPRGARRPVDREGPGRDLVSDGARAALEGWASEPSAVPEEDRSTTNRAQPRPGSRSGSRVKVERGLRPPEAPLDCGNSGTTMRLLSGVLAGCRLRVACSRATRASRRRPMERVAEPLRAMGARIRADRPTATPPLDGARAAGSQGSTTRPPSRAPR